MPELHRPRPRFKFFIKKTGCPKCQSTKTIITDLSIAGENVEVYYLDDDLVTVDGMTEVSLCSVISSPTIVLLRDFGNGNEDDLIIARVTTTSQWEAPNITREEKEIVKSLSSKM